MNTEKIDEAEIVTENNTQQPGDDDLLKSLAQQTEKKTAAPPVKEKSEQSFWSQSDDDFEKSPAPAQTEKKPQEKEKEKEEPVSGKPTEKAKLGSARTATGMVDLGLKTLLLPIHNYRLKKKVEKTFTEKQAKLLEEELIDAELSELDAAEMALKKRFERIVKKAQRKLDSVPLTKEEKEDLTDAWKNYFDYTEQTLSPAAYLAMTMTITIGRRAIDTFID